MTRREKKSAYVKGVKAILKASETESGLEELRKAYGNERPIYVAIQQLKRQLGI